MTGHDRIEAEWLRVTAADYYAEDLARARRYAERQRRTLAKLVVLASVYARLAALRAHMEG